MSPPPRRRRRAGLFVALGVLAAFAIGVAGAEIGRYEVSATAAPTVSSPPTTVATPDVSTAPNATPSDGSTGSGTDTASVAAIIDPALVDIVSTFGYQQASGAGTGIVLTSTGEIVTNNHVISGATSIRVTDVASCHPTGAGRRSSRVPLSDRSNPPFPDETVCSFLSHRATRQARMRASARYDSPILFQRTVQFSKAPTIG